ncbi:hypothetical protein PMAYCL1PPCAC_21976, partial [Pristionchus mayeri]
RCVTLLMLPILILAHRSWAQTCGTTPLGPCLDTMCPTGTTCLTNLSPAVCCNTASIVTTTTTTTQATTTVPTSNCVDRLNPTTGVSDCPSRAYLCTNTVYYTLMTQQCPK